MFGMFKSKAREARAGMAKLENKDLMEAVIAGAVLVAAADGELEVSELDKIDKLLKTNKQMAHFGSEITRVLGEFKEQFTDGGFRVIKMNALRELEDVKHNPKDAETVMVTMLTVAEADGEIEEAEMKILEQVATLLGVRLKDML